VTGGGDAPGLTGGRHALVSAAAEGQRERLGGAPTAFDRTLATRLGGKAVELLLRGDFGHMVANHPPDIVPVSRGDVVGKRKQVAPDYDLLATARALGVSFADSGGPGL